MWWFWRGEGLERLRALGGLRAGGWAEKWEGPSLCKAMLDHVGYAGGRCWELGLVRWAGVRRAGVIDRTSCPPRGLCFVDHAVVLFVPPGQRCGAAQLTARVYLWFMPRCTPLRKSHPVVPPLHVQCIFPPLCASHTPFAATGSSCICNRKRG